MQADLDPAAQDLAAQDLAAQAELDLYWVQRTFCRFCHALAHLPFSIGE